MQERNNYLSGVVVRRRRRRIYLFIVVLGAAFFLLASGGKWIFISSPFFQIQKIDIEGNNFISKTDVQNLLNVEVLQGAGWKSVFGVENILVWPSKINGASDFAMYPAIKSINISKNYFSRSVSVKVEERTPIGVWCYENNGSCWWFDDEGVIFRRSSTTEGNLIVMVRDYSQHGGGLNSKILPDRFMKNFLSIIRVTEKSTLDEKEILLRDLAVEEVEVLTGVGSGSSSATGPKLYFSLRFPADSALAALGRLETKPGFKNLQYIDFRVENRAYYK